MKTIIIKSTLSNTDCRCRAMAKSEPISIMLIFMLISALLVWSPSVNATDGDNDGFADSVDDCPFATGSSTNGLIGCPDADQDGIADSQQGSIADFSSPSREYQNSNEFSGGISEWTSWWPGGLEWGGGEQQSRAFDIAPNGMVVFGSDDGDHIFLAQGSGSILKSLTTIGCNPSALDFSPNGNLLAASGFTADTGNAIIHIYEMDWNTLTINLVANLSSQHPEPTFTMSFNPGGSQLYVGGMDNNLTIYNTTTWVPTHTIELVDYIFNIAPSPDGRMFAITEGPRLSVFWSSNGSLVYNVNNHTEMARGLDWSPDGRWIITGSNDNWLYVYHAENGTISAEMWMNRNVYSVSFNKVGSHFILGTHSNSPIYSMDNLTHRDAAIYTIPYRSNVASWSHDETKVHLSLHHFGGFQTWYSEDAYIWMGGDVTGQLMESRFAEYSEFGGDYLPNHYNASISTITQAQCSQSNEFGGILMGAGSTTSAESLTTPLGNYSVSGLRSCNSNGDLLVDVPVGRMPATIAVKANGTTQQCLAQIGGLSMGQVRWMLSGASASNLMGDGFHPAMEWSSVVPSDDGDSIVEWGDLHASCADEPIHVYHRWENRSVTQMIDAFLFCNHCNFPENWFEQDINRYRIVEETRSEVVNGVQAFDGAIAITELRVGLSSDVYNIPLIDNWTHGAFDAILAGGMVIHPSVVNSSTGQWPFQDNYYLTMREDSISDSRNFVEWMLSETGKENFDEIGFVGLDPFARVLSGDRVGLDLRNILPDTDEDGVWDGDDLCPGTDLNVSVDSTGCAQNQLDDDGDGLVNSQDDCPSVNGTSLQPTVGCPDDDGDGWADTGDAFPRESTQWSDVDGDGYGDNAVGIEADSCINEYGLSTEDRYGCLDTDGDGWSDMSDVFPANPTQWIDSDNDGYGDNYSCSEVVNGICVSEIGDAFQNDISQHKDRDGDGFGDNSSGFLADNCPDQAGTSNQGGVLGCPDADGDGWSDQLDDFPNESSQHIDSDGDGYGDTQSGVNADNCRGTPQMKLIG